MISLVLLALFAGALEVTRSVNCSLRANDLDCDRETASAFAADANGAVFDRTNGLAGHVAPVDQLMELSARYALFVVAGLAVVSWFIRSGADRERRLAVYTAVASALLAVLVASIIQHLYVHERPFVLRSDVNLLIPHGADPSFPSEHSSAAFAIATGIALYRPRFGLILLVLASVVGLARVYVGLHYPADVAGGVLVGASAAGAVWVARPLLAWLDANVVVRLLPVQLR